MSPPTNKYAEVCAVCHQATGLGLEGAFPPLAGSEWLNGRAVVPIAIVLHGLQGEISVKGKTYNGAMVAWGSVLNDEDLAATLTYARSQWGNRAAAVTAAQVRAARARFASRTTPWTAAELKAIR
jgi:mono/diheme cytochrome c family protein